MNTPEGHSWTSGRLKEEVNCHGRSLGVMRYTAKSPAKMARRIRVTGITITLPIGASVLPDRKR